MKKISYRIGCCSIFALLLFNHSGCIDKSFIEIEPQTDSTVIAANTTIAELKALYTGNLLQLDETTFSGRDSIFIEGIVTSDDRSGNFYKSIVIQDTTGGIEVRIDKTYLYNDFRRGQRVVVVCNNLYIGDNGGLIQIGSTYTLNGDRLLGGVDGDVLINKHLLRKGHAIVPVAPLIFEPSTLTISNLSRLIAVDEAEFLEITSTETGDRLTFGNQAQHLPLDHSLDVCGQVVTGFMLRSSGYATFANDTLPSLKGSITGILSYDNGTFLLLIRDLDDIDFVFPRCNPF